MSTSHSLGHDIDVEATQPILSPETTLSASTPANVPFEGPYRLIDPALPVPPHPQPFDGPILAAETTEVELQAARDWLVQEARGEIMAANGIAPVSEAGALAVGDRAESASNNRKISIVNSDEGPSHAESSSSNTYMADPSRERSTSAKLTARAVWREADIASIMSFLDPDELTPQNLSSLATAYTVRSPGGPSGPHIEGPARAPTPTDDMNDQFALVRLGKRRRSSPGPSSGSPAKRG
ncbi:hypothetical protein JCM24511_00679 [Saitozyma sp. JCM 24511]|nr:hypothetical protein JCM24511_00679 [Saitozyma sp. JCM 24511]